MATKRTATMPPAQLRVGDIVLREGRRWRVAKVPFREVLDSGRVRWHISLDALDASDLLPDYHHIGYVMPDSIDWLVEF